MPREDAPCRIAATRILGNHRTRAAVIERELQRAYRAREVGEIWRGLADAQQRLSALGIFKGVRFDLVRNNGLSRPAWPGRGGKGGAVADLVVTKRLQPSRIGPRKMFCICGVRAWRQTGPRACGVGGWGSSSSSSGGVPPTWPMKCHP